MKPSFVFLLLALIAVVPASALAFRPAPDHQLALSVQIRALRMGDRGAEVASLQQLLRERGFEPGPIDGIFGPLTLGAVKRSQEAYSLVVDGLAGRLTVGALRSGPTPVARAATAASGLIIYQAQGDPAGEGEPARAEQRRESAPVETGQAARLAVDSGPLQASPAVLEAGPGLQLRGAAPAFAPAPAAPATPASPAAAASEPVGVALTLDGLPDEPDLVWILEQLHDRGMQATFFVWGEEAEARPDLLKRIQKAGHEVASLGFTPLDMRQVSPITARALLRRTQGAITEAIGVAPGYFRPPLGRFDRQLNQLVEAEGLTMVLWSNVAVRPVPEMEADRLAEGLARSLFPGAVLMLPMDRPNAVAAVEPLLQRLEAGGYRSRTLSGLTGRGTGR